MNLGESPPKNLPMNLGENPAKNLAGSLEGNLPGNPVGSEGENPPKSLSWNSPETLPESAGKNRLENQARNGGEYLPKNLAECLHRNLPQNIQGNLAEHPPSAGVCFVENWLTVFLTETCVTSRRGCPVYRYVELAEIRRRRKDSIAAEHPQAAVPPTLLQTQDVSASTDLSVVI